MDLAKVIAQIEKLEAHALSPDPALPAGAPFSWLVHFSPTQRHTTPIILGRTTLATVHEAIRRPLNHKAPGPYGVPDMILNHMPPGFHEAL